MEDKHTIRRYSAYYRGWCQAFGEHDISFEEQYDINWLYGESQIGLALARQIKEAFLKELLGKRSKEPLVSLSPCCVQINQFRYPITLEHDKAGVDRVIELLRGAGGVHMYLTAHFCYPSGTRIVTFSKRKPLSIMYREMEPLTVRVF